MTRKGWLLFWAMAALWGLPYFFIKVAVREIDPAVVVFARTAIALVVLLPLAWWRGALHGMGKAWPVAILFALVHMVGPFLLISYGEQHITSSLASLLIAATPLLVAVLALAFFRSEAVTVSRLLGLALGFAGLVVLLGFDLGGDGQQMLGAGLVLGAVVGYAIGPLLLKHSSLAALPRLAVATAECSVTSLVLLPVTIWRLPSHMPSGDVALSLLALGLLCTALALVIFFTLIAEVGASRATVITYLNPVVATALGVVVLHDRLTWVTIAAIGLILLGSWLSTAGSLPFVGARAKRAPAAVA